MNKPVKIAIVVAVLVIIIVAAARNYFTSPGYEARKKMDYYAQYRQEELLRCMGETPAWVYDQDVVFYCNQQADVAEGYARHYGYYEKFN